jgi:DNA repair photolyase
VVEFTLQPIFQFVEWAAQKGLITVAEAIGVMFFIYAHTSTQKTFRNTLRLYSESAERTFKAQQSQIAEQNDDKHVCEERYKQLRIDMNVLHEQVNKQSDIILNTVLSHLKENTPNGN